MPFYKYIIYTSKALKKNKEVLNVSENDCEFDDSAISNQKMVNAMRHLSQLIRIADDIFGAIEIECRSVFERTSQLNIKIQQCQKIVDNLNAKAVKVPVSSLTGSQRICQPFKSYDVEKSEKVSIFSRIPRPAAVEYLRDLAYGPTPPVVIPCGMVASEVDGLTGTISSSYSSSTHIYCKPVKIIDICQSRSNIQSDETNGCNKSMTSTVKVPSSVVAIDVSGQPFSRMANFRRSLIHVDFFIRKKKKDKRRNTVAEGDVKELKDALQAIVNDERQFAVPNNTICSYEQIIADSKNAYNSKVLDNQMNHTFSEEQNNNSNVLRNSKSVNGVENRTAVEDKSKCSILNSDGKKHEQKFNCDSENILKHPLNKRKPKSHIPISTISAAMNVAVEMRQCNGVKTETPIANGICNKGNFRTSNPDHKMRENNRHLNSSINEDDVQQDDGWANYKKRLREKCRNLTGYGKYSTENCTSKETEVSSSASSENIDPQDNLTAEATSTESETFFISSDESDEDSSDVNFQENCGSSISLGTTSDGSLNSLLSETGTEMTSSTGTLTSVGHDYIFTPLPPPPPPPPPMILSANIKDKDIIAKVPQSACFNYDSIPSKGKKNKQENEIKKVTKQIKTPKPLKTDISHIQKNVTENSKNIFSSLMKTNSKGKSKCKKEIEKKKVNKTAHQPAFDMYGNNSPSMMEHIPAFIKENTSSVVQSEGKNHMKSFSVNDTLKKAYLRDDEQCSNSNIASNRHSSHSNYENGPEDIKESQNNTNIPSKYEHQVIVTPVHRNANNENKNAYHTVGHVVENQPVQQYFKFGNNTRSNNLHTDTQIPTATAHRSAPPTTLQQDRSKLAARVVLDFDGKVIYSTNSLDRKHYNISHSENKYTSVTHKSSEPQFEHTQFINENCCNLCPQNHIQQNSQIYMAKFSTYSPYSPDVIHADENAKIYSPNIRFDYSHDLSREVEHYVPNDPYISNQIHERRINSSIKSPQNRNSENMHVFVPNRMDAMSCSFAENASDIYLKNTPNSSFKPDPNISGLPLQETMLTKYNVTLHAKQMEKMSTCASEDSFSSATSSSFFLSPIAQNNGNISNKSPQSTMSTEHLFAVIHNCKKRLNIKTDSDISLASSSSRSSSPSYLRPCSSKGTLAETGFLSPRNQTHLETSGDRRSWADFRPVDSITSERKSLASDRLGPTKPTSMHDFKMLLLQARSSQISGPRKSAVEMLKIPSNQDSKNTLPLNLSPRNSMSFSHQNSPSIDLNLHNGHSTVPFKRGNRVRASLQSRYIMYPPIFEDCSEDSENCNDIL